MKKTLTTRVGPDGVLTIPLERQDADKMVRVNIEALEDAGTLPDGADWLRFLERTGGQITDASFERPPQGKLDEREPLS